MMKKLMATVGVLALLIGTGFAQDAATKECAKDGRAHMKGDNHHSMMADLPDLTEEQKTQMKAIKEESRKKMEPQREQMKVIRTKLMELKAAEDPNQTEINRLIDESAKLKAEMEKSKTAAELKVRSILTPEQRKVLDVKMKEKQAMREKQHMEKKEMRKAK